MRPADQPTPTGAPGSVERGLSATGWVSGLLGNGFGGASIDRFGLVASSAAFAVLALVAALLLLLYLPSHPRSDAGRASI